MARNPNHVHKNTLTTNQRIAAFFAGVLGSPWTIYIFIALACISLPQVIKSHDTVLIVSWVTQTFIQLVALAVLQSKAELDGKHSEHVANEIYENMLKIEEMDESINGKLDKLLEKR